MQASNVSLLKIATEAEMININTRKLIINSIDKILFECGSFQLLQFYNHRLIEWGAKTHKELRDKELFRLHSLMLKISLPLNPQSFR